MIIAGVYSFNGGQAAVESRYGKELREIKQCIALVDSAQHKTKVSKEKTMPGKILYQPGALNFGKYAFMVYNVCAKMTIFHKLDLIDVGVEIVPVKAFADEMSTGVSYFEQFVWDLEHRGVADIDIPVLILGLAA